MDPPPGGPTWKVPGMVHAHPEVRKQWLNTAEGVQNANAKQMCKKHLEKQTKGMQRVRTCNIKTQFREDKKKKDKVPPTRNSEHVTCVKRHVRVTVGGGAATLRVPVLPQVRRQQSRRQGGQRTCL